MAAAGACGRAPPPRTVASLAPATEAIAKPPGIPAASPPPEMPPITARCDAVPADPPPRDAVEAEQREAANAIRGRLFAHERERLLAARAFRETLPNPRDTEHPDAQEPDGTPDAEMTSIDLREACGRVPPFDSVRRLDVDGDGVLDAYFSGAIATDAGGDDESGWSELVVHVARNWKRVDVDLDARGIDVWRTESGDVLWTHLDVVDQCGATLRVFHSSGADVELVHAFPVSRDISGACPMLMKVEPILTRRAKGEPPVLRGFQEMTRPDEDAPWTSGPTLSYAGGRWTSLP